jgi:hypothetical protein
VQTIADLPAQNAAGLRRSMLTATIEALETGSQNFLPLPISYQLPDRLSSSALVSEAGKQRTMATPSLTLEIFSVLSEGEQPTQFRSLKEPQPLPVSAPPSRLPWLGLLFILPAIALAWYRFGRHRAPDPRHWANSRIDEIAAQFAAGTLAPGQAYAQLSATIREYFQWTNGLPATARSSDELLEDFSRMGFEPALLNRLQKFLTESDRVQFAGVESSNGPLPFEEVRIIIGQAAEAGS